MSKEKPCGGCGDDNVATVGNTKVWETPHAAVVASYGLCLTRDDFVVDKCIWVVDLKDGTKIFQDDDRPGLHVPSSWRRLGYYAEDHPDNPIVRMRLRFGTHIVALPGDQPFYFYSRGIIQAMTQTHGLDFHIVGGPNDTGDITCVWYKAPELIATQQAARLISDCQPEQLIGSVPQA